MRVALQLILALALVTPLFAADTDPAAPCQVEVQLHTHSGIPVPDGVVLQLWAGKVQAAERVVVGGLQNLHFAELPCQAWTLAIGQRRFNGSVSIWEEFRHDPHEGSPWSVTIYPVQPVSLQVTNRDGNGVPGGWFAMLTLKDNPNHQFGGGILQPDSLGVARLLLHESSYRLRIPSSKKIESLQIDGVEVEAANRILVVKDRPIHIRVTVAAEQKIQGRIVNEQGNGVEGINVVVITSGNNWNRSSLSDEEGIFAASIDTVPVRLIPQPTSEYSRFQPAVQEILDADSSVEFLAIKEDAGLVGWVVDAVSGETVGNASISSSFVDCATSSVEQTFSRKSPWGQQADANGRFTSRCVPGCPLKITVRWPGDRQGYFSDIRSVHMIPGSECEGEHTLSLERGGNLTGLVQDRLGLPVADLALVIGNHKFQTESDGRFEFNHLSDRNYNISIARYGAAKREWKDQVLIYKAKRDRTPGPVQVLIEDGEGKDVELLVSRGGVLCANVSFENDIDNEIDGLKQIYLFDPERDKSVLNRRMPDPVAQPDRRQLCTPPAAPGDYLVLLKGSFVPTWLPGFPDRKDAVPVTIEAGETLDMASLRLDPTGALWVQTPGWPRLDDPEFVPVFEYAPVPKEDEEQSDQETKPKFMSHPNRWVQAKFTRERDPEVWAKSPSFILSYFPVGDWLLRACISETVCTSETTPIELPDPIKISVGKRIEVILPYPTPPNSNEN